MDCESLERWKWFFELPTSVLPTANEAMKYCLICLYYCLLFDSAPAYTVWSYHLCPMITSYLGVIQTGGGEGQMRGAGYLSSEQLSSAQLSSG